MNFYIIITALSVSLDSFFGGLSVKPKGFFVKSLKIILVVFAMCLTANYFGKLILPLFKSNTEVFGGLCLILVAIYQLLCEKKQSQNAYLIGFAIGIDGACANFSLAIMGYNFILVPLTLTFFHYIFLCVGYGITRIGRFKKISQNPFLAPCILTMLGIYKIILGLI